MWCFSLKHEFCSPENSSVYQTRIKQHKSCWLKCWLKRCPARAKKESKEKSNKGKKWCLESLHSKKNSINIRGLLSFCVNVSLFSSPKQKRNHEDVTKKQLYDSKTCWVTISEPSKSWMKNFRHYFNHA